MIEDTFSSEPADAAWAPAAELALREVFQHEDVGALALVEAACRTTMCRLEVAGGHLPAEDVTFEESFRTLIHLIPWSGQGFGRVEDAEGAAPTAVLYLTREGQVLPPLREQQ